MSKKGFREDRFTSKPGELIITKRPKPKQEETEKKTDKQNKK